MENGNTVIDWNKEYETNEKFRGYVDRYATTRDIEVSEALTHLMVHEYWNCVNMGLL